MNGDTDTDSDQSTYKSFYTDFKNKDDKIEETQAKKMETDEILEQLSQPEDEEMGKGDKEHFDIWISLLIFL